MTICTNLEISGIGLSTELVIINEGELTTEIVNSSVSLATEITPPGSNIINELVTRNTVMSLDTGSGIMGAKGEPGGQDIVCKAGEIIAAHKAVSLIGNMVVYTDITDIDSCRRFFGITINAGDIDSNITVRRFGEITDDSLSLNTDSDVFVTTSGTITTSTPLSATRFLIIGISSESNSFYINTPILWEEEI